MQAALKKYACPCSVYGGTDEERMRFAECVAAPFHMEKTWFSDDLHYYSYDEGYALEIDIYESFLVVFSCNDPALKEKAEFELNNIFSSMSYQLSTFKPR